MEANEHYLNEHLKEVDSSERAQDWKDDYVAELMTKGGDCYPYTHDNVLEALENRKTSDELFLTSCVISGCEAENPIGAMAFIGSAVKKVIFEYWKEAAEKKADADYSQRNSMDDVHFL